MRMVRGGGGSSERDGGLVGIYLVEADEGVDTRGEEVVQADIVGGELHEGYLQGGDGFSTESCSHAVSGGWEMQSVVVGEEV